ncbi:biopolymer transport protein ExbD [Sinobacterium caligoides]|uniref:Biopolymer transport protein ExbD n=1 Tax=Sinobacterium caligoides TaxID=933926 RepID=A0A3N2DN03_9GAMM|nr:biopolymer transporter ExbD [Sinobacterium caligoides]ROS01194.1 biopolymer transport protein ExbD [Sinobacterium caligoides]
MSLITAREKRSYFDSKLNLVSLMDIFTILVFFLLLNSGESQNLEQAKFITLPDSSTNTDVHGDSIITISDRQILFGNEAVIDLDDVVADKHNTIEALSDVLKKHAEELGELAEEQRARGYDVTIMGDKSVPYALLKTVMTTCNQQNYRNISLAVNQVSAPVIASSGISTSVVGG